MPTEPDPRPSGLATGALLVGVAGLVVGIAAVVLAQATRLDSTKLLAGGAYLKDNYRLALLAGGIAVGVLGLVLTVLGAAGRPVVRDLIALVGLAAAILLVGGAVLFAGYQTRQRALQTSTPAGSFAVPTPAPDSASPSQDGSDSSPAPSSDQGPSATTPEGQQELQTNPDCQDKTPPPGYTGPVQC